MVETKTELDRYLELTPVSRARWEEACEFMPGGGQPQFHILEALSHFHNRCLRQPVMDADGVQRIDFINTMTTMILGHGPAPVVNAVRRQLDKGPGLQRSERASD